MKPIHIVRLDGIHLPSPTFSIPHTYTEHATTTASETPSRIHDAAVLITTRVALTTAHLAPDASPHLGLIAVMAVGTDVLSPEAHALCRARAIAVCNVPCASNESVAEHAVALYMAVRRRVVVMDGLVKEWVVWPAEGTCTSAFGGLPGGWKTEVVGVVGVGELGNRIAAIAKALGMKTLLAERAGVQDSQVRPGRMSFEETLQSSTVLFLACPLNPSTTSMFGEPELRMMRPDAILISVCRGGVVVEEALVQALKEKWIAGAGLDVFAVEPADSENSILVAEGRRLANLVLSPHVAWYAKSSIDRLRAVTTENVESWARGAPTNVVL